MKYLRLALLVVASALTLAHAQQQDEDNNKRPPTEIPDFSNLDEYIYEPKSSVRLSFRHLSGAKTDFSGVGSILAPVDPNSGLGGHYYHDGEVRADSRTTPRVDNAGNPLTDPVTGATIGDPITPDGRTNTWTYTDTRQVSDAPLGFIAFHSFSANVIDSDIRHTESRSTNGLDLSVAYDMGKLLSGRIAWNLMAGMSVNDISARKVGYVKANVSKTTDLYSLYGQTAPGLDATGKYSAPSTASQTVTDSSGTVSSISVDNSVLIGSTPALSGTPVITTDITSVLNNWRLRGAYYTFRVGPELWYPITSKLKVGMSFGAAVVYSATSYSVTQTYTPEIGADITEFDTKSVSKLLPGLYADATVQYDLTEKAGFFAGAIYQTAQGYTQSLDTTTAKYVSKIDLSNQNGLRAGMSIRF